MPGQRGAHAHAASIAQYRTRVLGEVNEIRALPYQMALVCPLCPSELSSRLQFNTTDYLKHVHLFHAHQPNFQITCGISGCERTFGKFHTFRKHISDWHRDETNPTNPTNTTQQVSAPGLQEDDDDRDDVLAHRAEEPEFQAVRATPPSIHESSALFLMGLKEERKLTQVALQSVIEGVTSLTQIRLTVLHGDVCSKLQAAGISPSSIPGLDELFDIERPFGRPFMGLETQHQQLAFYKAHFGLIVSNLLSSYS